jgi:hypothetical protein
VSLLSVLRARRRAHHAKLANTAKRSQGTRDDSTSLL